MHRVLPAVLIAALAAFADAQPAVPTTGPSTADAGPATRPVPPWTDRPTPMLQAILASARPNRTPRPPLRRGAFSTVVLPGGAAQPDPFSPAEILRARTAPDRPTTRPTAAPTTTPVSDPADSPTTRSVAVSVASTRPTTGPAVTPTRLKIDLDAADGPTAAARLTAAFGQAVTVQSNTAVTFHGEPGPFAAAVAAFFETSGLTVGDNVPGLALVPGRPLRVVNVGDVGALVLTRVTLSARRSFTGDAANVYEYSLGGVFIPDPAAGVLGIASSQSVTVRPGPDRIRQNVNNGEPMSGGLRVSLGFTSVVPLKSAAAIVGRLRGVRVLDQAAVDVPFDRIAAGQPVTTQGVTATVTLPPQTNGAASLRVEIGGANVGLFRDYRWSQGFRQLVSVLDLDDAAMAVESYVESSDDRAVRLIVRSPVRASEFFDRLTTVRVRLPRTLKALDLPLEIKDLPLPGE